MPTLFFDPCSVDFKITEGIIALDGDDFLTWTLLDQLAQTGDERSPMVAALRTAIEALMADGKPIPDDDMRKFPARARR